MYTCICKKKKKNSQAKKPSSQKSPTGMQEMLPKLQKIVSKYSKAFKIQTFRIGNSDKNHLYEYFTFNKIIFTDNLSFDSHKIPNK